MTDRPDHSQDPYAAQDGRDRWSPGHYDGQAPGWSGRAGGTAFPGSGSNHAQTGPSFGQGADDGAPGAGQSGAYDGAPVPGQNGPGGHVGPGPVPGTDLGADLSASFRWMWSAFTANLATFLVPAVVFGLLGLALNQGPKAVGWFVAMSEGTPFSIDLVLYDDPPVWVDVLSAVASLLGAVLAILWSTGSYRAGEIVRNGGRPQILEASIGTGRLILASLLVGVLVVIGVFACILPGIVIGIVAMYTLPAVASGLRPLDGLKSSGRLVGAHLGISLVVVLIGIAAGLIGSLLLVGLFLATPLSALFLTALYQRLRGNHLAPPVRV